MSSYCCCNQL